MPLVFSRHPSPVRGGSAGPPTSPSSAGGFSSTSSQPPTHPPSNLFLPPLGPAPTYPRTSSHLLSDQLPLTLEPAPTYPRTSSHLPSNQLPPTLEPTPTYPRTYSHLPSNLLPLTLGLAPTHPPTCFHLPIINHLHQFSIKRAIPTTVHHPAARPHPGHRGPHRHLRPCGRPRGTLLDGKQGHRAGKLRLRSVPGPDYSSEDETTLASISAGGPLTFTSAEGFGLPGNSVSYKVYVRLTTGNEAGSDAVTVTRPL